MMTFRNYQIQAATFAEYQSTLYPFLGLAEETGELCGKVAKNLRGDHAEIDAEAFLKEAGDVLWMLTMCLTECGMSLQQAAEVNLEKLKVRKAKGLIKGEGDDREKEPVGEEVNG